MQDDVCSPGMHEKLKRNLDPFVEQRSEGSLVGARGAHAPTTALPCLAGAADAAVEAPPQEKSSTPTCSPPSACCTQPGFARASWGGQHSWSSHALQSSQTLCTAMLTAQPCHSMRWLPLPHPSASIPPQRSSACEHVVLTTTAKNLHTQVHRTQAKLQGLHVLQWASKPSNMRLPIDHMPLATHLRRLRRVNNFFPSQL